jgi:hypothetical protein
MTYTNQPSGVHTFYVKAQDSAGNIGSASSISWTIDLTPPTGTIKINNDAAYATNTIVNLSLASPDAVNMQFSNDGFNWTMEEGFAALRINWTMTAVDGNKTVSVRFKDAAGNWSQSYNDSITLDTIAPNTTITGYPSNPSTLDYAYFYFMSTETGSTFECNFDNSPIWSGCSSGTYLPALTNTTHIFSVRAKDPAGNTDGSPATYTWSVNAPGRWDTTGRWDQYPWGP